MRNDPKKFAEHLVRENCIDVTPPEVRPYQQLVIDAMIDEKIIRLSFQVPRRLT